MKLLETTYSPDLRVDPEAGIIHGVKILGSTSLNGRIYSRRAMHEAASMYEDIDVNIDHPIRTDPDAERCLIDGFGCLKGINVREDGVYGDLHFLKSHEHADVILERAKRMPQRFGLSHNADGHTARRGGTEVVESIERVRSVDLVRNPATVSTLYESENNRMTKTRTLREVLVHALPFGRGKLLEQDTIIADAMPAADVSVDVASEAPADDQVKAAFRAMVVAVFDDTTLDAKATLAKIKDILTAQTKLMEAPATDSDETVTGATTESHTKSTSGSDSLLESRLNRMENRELVREVLDGYGIGLYHLSPENRTLLKSQKDEASMRALIESWPPAARRLRTDQPRSARPLFEDQDNYEPAKTPEEFANAIR
ncbi:hypothetical protein [uncultured Mediterranean phage uvDeep-CGR2-KM19-C37]|nr:hypothetical protein [uncultured Mediterranean phage uvDeep-CGR2-KM19-C37]